MDEELDSIVSFLEPYGPVDSCYRRTYIDKITKQHLFKGSCFIIFKDLETCKKFVEAESIKFKDTELIRKFKNDYFEEKKKEIQERQKKNKKQKRDPLPTNAVEESTFPKGAILHFSGLKENQNVSREEIKEQLKKIDDVEISYIDYNKGDTEGHIRFSKENAAVELFKKLTDGEMEVGDAKIKFKVLEGDEEKNFLKDTANAINKIRQNSKRAKKRRGDKFGDSGPKNKTKKIQD